MDQENRGLYSSLFQNTKESTQVPFQGSYNENCHQIRCSAKSNELLLLGHKEHVSLIDLVTLKCHPIKCADETVTAVGIGYYNKNIFIGSSRGTLTMIQLQNTVKEFILVEKFIIKQFTQSVIQNVYSTNGDLVIVICTDEIQFFFANDALRQSVAQTDQQGESTIDANNLNISGQKFPVVITACEFSHQSNELVIALGNNKIFIYTIIGDSIDSVIKKAKKLKAEQKSGVITNLSIHNNGSLLAYTQINRFNKNDFSIIVSDLKKYEKTILKHKQVGEGKSVKLTFFPVSTRLLVAHDQKYFTIDIDSSELDNKFQNEGQEFSASAPVKNIYSLSQFQDFPNFLYIDEKGNLTTLVFDEAKIDLLQQIPFLYFIEQRLKETLGYQPMMEQFQKQLQIGFTGVDFEKKQVKDIMFNGETYFEPYFERIRKWRQLKDYYLTYRRKYLCYLSNEVNQPLKQIIDWNFKRSQLAPYPQQIQNQKETSNEKLNLIQDLTNVRLQTLPIETPQKLEQNREERYLQLLKLLNSIKPENKEIYFLGNCQFLFSNTLQLSKQVLDLLNRSQKIQYLDLSNNKVRIEFIQQIKRLNQLKFLDLSGNELGKFPQNEDIDQFQIYRDLFNQIPIINLRNNNYKDEHGKKLIQIFEKTNKIRLLDLSGNQMFAESTQEYLKNILDNKIQELNDTQTLIIEFSPLISQRSMIQLTNKIIRIINEQKIGAEQLKFFLYIVNSNQKIQWNQSLIEMYEETEQEKVDEVKSCIYAFLLTLVKCFKKLFKNIKSNFCKCVAKTLCSTLIVKKYIFCCYCIFLQTSIGKLIQKILGVKTADYEYNEKKDELKKKFESNIQILRIIFVLNFLAFYFICVFTPFYFVSDCSHGIKWIGHYIYIGYAGFMFSVEILLSQICINYGVTHDDYSKGTLLSKIFYYGKDLFLSQLSKFDVYSDFCFIATIMECGDNNLLAYIATGVMFITLFTTFIHLINQIRLSYASQEVNYFDFVCNYCSFVEMHVVASLLERWSVQNQNDFLCIKGIPSRVYASIMRGFAEDLPQFTIQLIYIITAQKKNGLMLILSIISSVFSIVISLTKSLTITKASRINDKIQMTEFKKKLQVREGDVDPQLKEDLVEYLFYFPNLKAPE